MANDTPKKPGDEKQVAQQTGPQSSDKAAATPPAAKQPDKPGPTGKTAPTEKAQDKAPAGKQAEKAPAASGQAGPKAATDKAAPAAKQPDKAAAPAEKAAAEKPVAAPAKGADKPKAAQGKEGADKPAAKAAPAKTVTFPTKGKESPRKQAAKKQLADTPASKAAKAPAAKTAPAKEPEPPPMQPTEAPRNGKSPEKIEFINLSELHAFKDHPFQVRDDEEMRAMVESVKDKGVTQPAIVRPRKGGGYELVSGHRRHKASQLAGYTDIPCIVRNLSDEQAITQMVEDNTNQRENILPSERAKALYMQLEAIKHQGSREASGHVDPKEVGMRSNEIVASRNKMTVKTVQRYIRLNALVPELRKMVDEKAVSFTPAVELSYVRPKNQRYIAVAIEGQASGPSLSQAQRLRDLDQKGVLKPDTIDGIMMEEKKEVDKVIINSQELSKYFGKELTPQQMKDKILAALDKTYPPKELAAAKAEKKPAKEK